MGPSISTQSQQPDVYQPGISVDDLQLILTQTPTNVWEELQGQRIFITGGTGFVGCWLLEALIWANQELRLDLQVTVLSRNPAAFRSKVPHLATHPLVRLIEGNVNDLSNIDEPFDIIVHAATDVAAASADPGAHFDDIVNGTKQTLDLARRSKASRYLLTSSGAVYGRQQPTMPHIAEEYSGAPDTMDSSSAYGQGKRVSEWLVQCHAKQFGLKSGIARCFALIGPYLPLDAHFAVGNFVRDGLSGRPIRVSGDGSAYRSYLYAADMTIWLFTILFNGRAGQSYNVGSGHAITIGDLAETVSNIVYGEKNVSIEVPLRAGAPAQRYVPSADKANRELQLAEYTELTSAIRKTVNWVIQNKLVAAHAAFGVENV